MGNEHGEVSVMESQAAEAKRENTSPAPPPPQCLSSAPSRQSLPNDKGRTFKVQILFHRQAIESELALAL